MDLLPVFENNLFTYLFYAFCVFAGIQLIFSLGIFARFAFFFEKKKTRNFDSLPPVSIIIAARNEADNLYNFLPLWLEQDYPEFELIIINHQSVDDSYNILHAYQREYPNLKVVELNKNNHLRVGKKLPISLGVKAAKYENLVFTDADCKPASTQWLKYMASNFTESKQMVIGYGPYIKRDGFLNKVIRFDTLMIAVSYFSFALSKIPYMSVGRNFAYNKSLFNSVSGFKSHYGIASGDDDLFVQQAARKGNFAIEIDPKTHCFSEPKKTWGEWLNQKSRHYTTSDVYKPFIKLLLGIYPLTVILFWAFAIGFSFHSEFRYLVWAVFLFVVVIKWITHGRAFKKLKSSSFILAFPILDLLYAILMPIIFYTSERNQFARWK